MKRDICRGSGLLHEKKKRRRHPHELCPGCRAISLPARDSDWWICCKCFQHVAYANPTPPHPRGKYPEHPNHPSDIETWAGPAPRLRIGVK